MSDTTQWVVTGTSMVVEAEDQFAAVDRAQESSGWHWEARPWVPNETTALDGVEALVTAIDGVTAAWESGNLAEAVRYASAIANEYREMTA